MTSTVRSAEYALKASRNAPSSKLGSNSATISDRVSMRVFIENSLLLPIPDIYKSFRYRSS